MEERRCLNCLKLIQAEVCPHCGATSENTNLSHQLPMGTLLQERYLIGRVLGQGGFGITYRGWDLETDEPIAVKEYYPGAIVTRDCNLTHQVSCNSDNLRPNYESSRDRFIREAKALERFRDVPEIVSIKAFLEENDTAYIVMEYVQGSNLGQYIHMRGGHLSADETFRILRPVIQAMASVHKEGLVHRDISPDNIMLHPRGGAKLLDFGAVRLVENPDTEGSLERSTEAILKHGFAPIEQYQSRGSLGPWTDVYAMCATIYYCLTGRIPEDAPARMIEEKQMDLSQLPGLTDYQQKALEKGLGLRARDRQSSMEELMESLFPEEHAESSPPQKAQDPEKKDPKPQGGKAASGKKKWRSAIIWTILLLLPVAIMIINYTQNHQWTEATCTDPSVCIICGRQNEEALGHSFDQGTCYEAPQCTRCGIREGTIPGHNWQDATYTEPQTCKRCGLTRGTVRGYLSRIGGTWDVFFPDGTARQCLILSEPFYRCRGFCLDLEVSATYGTIDGRWEAFCRTAGDTWTSLGYFEVVQGKAYYSCELDPDMEVNAIAVVMANGYWADYQVDFTVEDVYYYE